MAISDILSTISQPSVLVVVVLALWVTWRVSKWSAKVESELDFFGKRLDTVEKGLDSVEKRLDTVEKGLDTVETRLGTLEEKVSIILNMLSEYLGKPVAGATSPLNLNDYGESIANEIDAKKIAQLFCNKININAEKMNAYEIQQSCFDYAENKIVGMLKEEHPQYYENVTEYAYKNGVKIDKVMRVVGIILRDMVLTQSGKAPLKINKHT